LETLEFIESKRLKREGDHLKITFYYAEDTIESGAMLRLRVRLPECLCPLPTRHG
jgi:hypothetical protein